MQKKRLVYLSAFLSPYRSGAEAMVEEVALRLADTYDITIVTGRYSRKLPKNDFLLSSTSPQPLSRGERGYAHKRVQIIRVGIGLPIDKWLFPFLAPLRLGSLKPDIIHAVLETFAGLALFFCRCTAKKILTLQTTNRSFLKGTIIRYPDTVTAISTALVRAAASLGRTDVMVIPNGIDCAAIKKSCAFHAKIPGRILFVGRLEAMKGVDTLLKAMGDERLANIDWTLRIVGSGSKVTSLKALAKQLGITDRVTFTGRLIGKAVYDEYAAAEIFCGLSRSEALGNVFLEAQAAGCAVVATNVGGIPEIVHDGETGILVAPDDPIVAATALLSLLREPARRLAYGAASGETCARYDWSSISGRYAALYAR